MKRISDQLRDVFLQKLVRLVDLTSVRFANWAILECAVVPAQNTFIGETKSVKIVQAIG
jgi:hypothetical protein